jgi:hypothetical protein
MNASCVPPFGFWASAYKYLLAKDKDLIARNWLFPDGKPINETVLAVCYGRFRFTAIDVRTMLVLPSQISICTCCSFRQSMQNIVFLFHY